ERGPLVRRGVADLWPVGRRELHARLAAVEATPSLWGITLAFALRGELPIAGKVAVEAHGSSEPADPAPLLAVLRAQVAEVRAQTNTPADVIEERPPEHVLAAKRGAGIMPKFDLAPPKATSAGPPVGEFSNLAYVGSPSQPTSCTPLPLCGRCRNESRQRDQRW